MKVSQLKNATEQFLISHGDAEVMLCWEEGVFLEGYDPEHEEPVNDARVVPDWPLPGCSLIYPHEEMAQKFVLFYGDNEGKNK